MSDLILPPSMNQRLADDYNRLGRLERKPEDEAEAGTEAASVWLPFSSLTPGDYGVRHDYKVRYHTVSDVTDPDDAVITGVVDVSYWIAGVEQTIPFVVDVAETMKLTYDDLGTDNLGCLTLYGNLVIEDPLTEEPTDEENLDDDDE